MASSLPAVRSPFGIGARTARLACVAALVFLAPPAARGQSLLPAVQPFVDRGEVAGAVMLVADAERILFLEAAGSADIAAKKPMPTDAMFWIASQSKPITAAALMILVDAGMVGLDDPVERHLPEFRGQRVVVEKTDDRTTLARPLHPITVREILDHTSGLPFRSELEVPTLDRWPLEARVRSYAAAPLDFQPGTRYQYSNAGINTAARIVEVVSGLPFETFLDERLFRPLGMTDTTFWPDKAQAARIATAYKPASDTTGPEKTGLSATTIDQLHYPLGDRAERAAMPAGGLFSTARDVARFYQMLLNRGQWQGTRVLSAAAVDELTRRQTPDALPTSYGLGFSTGSGTFGHGGAYSTNTVAHVPQGIVTVWLVQHAGFPGTGDQAEGTFRAKALEAFGKR